MAAPIRFQITLLLLLGQILLGTVGWFLADRFPWAGLLATLFLFWFVWRLGIVYREEAERTARGRRTAIAGVRAWTAILAQIPGLLLLPFWAPEWIHSVWQGAFLPAVATLNLFLPSVRAAASPWLWLSAIPVVALFTWASRPTAERRSPQEEASRAAAAGDWVPARRLADVQKHGKKVR